MTMRAGVILLAICVSALGANGLRGEDETIQVLPAGYPEGPLWRGEDLYYAEMTHDRISVLREGTVRAFWHRPRCGPTAIAPYGDTEFVILCHREAALVRVDMKGRTRKVIRHDSTGRRLSNPNDATPDQRGGIFFSDSGEFRADAPATGIVYHIDPDGRINPVLAGLAYANGVYFHGPSRILYVSEHLGRRVLAVAIGSDGSPAPIRIFADFGTLPAAGQADYGKAGPDGIEVDSAGRVWVSHYGAGRALAFDQTGAFLGGINLNTPFLTNISFSNDGLAAFTGAENNSVHPFAGAVVIRTMPSLGRRLEQGRPSFSPPAPENNTSPESDG